MVYELASQSEIKIDSKRLPPVRDPEMSILWYFIIVKLQLLSHTVLSLLFLMGLSSTIARYLRKLVHRFAAESPKVYNLSFWAQIVALAYLTYLFLADWDLGCLSDR